MIEREKKKKDRKGESLFFFTRYITKNFLDNDDTISFFF